MKPKIGKTNEEKRIYWKGVIHEWKQSGKSQVQYCAENKIKINTFGYWQKRLINQKKLLVPVQVREARLVEPVVFRIETPQGLKIFVPSGSHASDIESIFKLLGVMK